MGAAILLMVLGALTALVNALLFVRVSSGEDLELGGLQASIESSSVAIALSGAGAALGVLAVVAGVGVLLRRQTWRIVGITVAVIAAGSGLFNIFTLLSVNAAAALPSLLIVIGWIYVVVGLVRGGAAFPRPASPGRIAIATVVTVGLVAAAGIGAAAVGSQTVTATMRDYSVSLDTATASSGPLAFEVTNEGPSVHEFWVYETDLRPEALPVDPALGRISEFGPGFTAVLAGLFNDLAPGSTETIDLSLEAGNYVIVCNVEGHYQRGMHTPFTVS